jgi:hypothetical protein
MAHLARVLERRAELKAVLDEDHPMTVRQIYYQAVVRGIVETNTPQSYGKVDGDLVEMRNEGEIPYDWIDDHSREYRGATTGWPGDVESFYQSKLDDLPNVSYYRRNPWEGQKNYVEVWVEKDAMAGTLERIVSELDFPHVPVNVCRGYGSLSYLAVAAERLKAEQAAGRRLVILYFGDFDPSGEDMVGSHVTGAWEPGDVFRRLMGLGVRVPLIWKQALTVQQFEEWFTPDPITGRAPLPYSPNPIKDTDSRAASFRAKYGDHGAELDAVPRAWLEEILRSRIGPDDGVINMGAYQEVLLKQAAERDELEARLMTVREFAPDYTGTVEESDEDSD